jgi:hypothetical protein
LVFLNQALPTFAFDVGKLQRSLGKKNKTVSRSYSPKGLKSGKPTTKTKYNQGDASPLINTHSFRNLTRINTKQKQEAPLSKSFSAVGVGSSSPLGPSSSRPFVELELQIALNIAIEL